MRLFYYPLPDGLSTVRDIYQFSNQSVYMKEHQQNMSLQLATWSLDTLYEFSFHYWNTLEWETLGKRESQRSNIMDSRLPSAGASHEKANSLSNRGDEVELTSGSLNVP